MKLNQTRKRLLKVFKENKGRCYYCDCKTVLPKQRRDTNGFSSMATYEHFYPNMDIRRLICHKGTLSCYSCNTAKAHRDYDLVFNNGTYQTKEYGNTYQLTNGLLQRIYSGQVNQFII